MSLSEKEKEQSSFVHDLRQSNDSVLAEETGTRPAGIRRWYEHTLTQVIMLGLVCFMGPGLFDAVNGLGAGGQVDATTSANGNTALYATFAFTAFFAGSINNYLGPRLTLLLGSTGYSLYIGSYLATNIHKNAGWFIIMAGAILGVCAGLLWTAQGSLMLAYPTEQNKGLYISIFWATFNLGGVVGAAVALGQNIHSQTNAVQNGTYIGFLALTVSGVFIPMLMADPKKMYRTDGTKVTAPRYPSWKKEVYSLYVALVTDPAIVLLFPMFFASNYFCKAETFNDYNGALFNIRTRALNNLCYWTSQIVGKYTNHYLIFASWNGWLGYEIGSAMMGLLLDLNYLPRRTRGFLGWGILFVMVFGVHGWAYHYQKGYTRQSVASPDFHKIDFNDKGYAAYIWLYIFFAFLDSMWQTAAYWMMGAMSNDPAKLAIFTGFYKSIQSAGGAGAWRADAVGLPYMNIFASTWALLIAGLVFALPMLYTRVKSTTTVEDEVIARIGEDGSDFAEVVKP
ncbi:hypothetical protein FRB99_000523 [Tulasnella sp. 403]|nr:hypothetical protein FRB99_000523 [Tulasnella sp. 403]